MRNERIRNEMQVIREGMRTTSRAGRGEAPEEGSKQILISRIETALKERSERGERTVSLKDLHDMLKKQPAESPQEIPLPLPVPPAPQAAPAPAPGPGPVPGPINPSEDPKIISDPRQRVKARITKLTDSFCPCDACLKDLASLIKEIKSTPSLNAARLLPSDFKEALSKLDVLAKANAKALEALTGEPLTLLNSESSLAPITSNDLHGNKGLVELLLTDPAKLQKLDGTLDPTFFQNLADKQDQLFSGTGIDTKSMREYEKNSHRYLNEITVQLESLLLDSTISPDLKEIVTELLANFKNSSPDKARMFLLETVFLEVDDHPVLQQLSDNSSLVKTLSQAKNKLTLLEKIPDIKSKLLTLSFDL